MRCPDRDTIARLLDREGLEVKRELSAHIRNCPRCQRVVSEDGERDGALSFPGGVSGIR